MAGTGLMHARYNGTMWLGDTVRAIYLVGLGQILAAVPLMVLAVLICYFSITYRAEIAEWFGNFKICSCCAKKKRAANGGMILEEDYDDEFTA